MADKLTALLAATVRDIAAISDAAYEDLMQQIADGTDPRLATERVLVQFRGDYVTQLSEAFSAVLERNVTAGNILHIPVGGVFLSQTLYLHIRQTSLEVAAVVRLHAQGLQSASRLARLLYDGYDPKDGIKRPLEGVARAQLPKGLRELTADPAARQSLQAIYTQLQQAASRTKSEALRASYLELLEAWKRGAGQDVLDKKLWVAEREKTRNMAERIAVTELARAHNTKLAREIMEDESVEVVEIRLNPRHPKPDICDIHAKVNAYGLGAGVYPKAVGPRPPFHPRCWCRATTRPDLSAEGAKLNSEAVRQYLGSLPPATAASVLGSRERLEAVMGGKDWEAVTQASIRPEYRLGRIGDPPKPPVQGGFEY